MTQKTSVLYKALLQNLKLQLAVMPLLSHNFSQLLFLRVYANLHIRESFIYYFSTQYMRTFTLFNLSQFSLIFNAAHLIEKLLVWFIAYKNKIKNSITFSFNLF